MMKHIINLVMGDWSHDGHGLSKTIAIKSNLSKKQMESAYRFGANKIGVDVANDVSSDYEDHCISEENFQAFVKAGFDWDKLGYDSVEDNLNCEDISISNDTFVQLYLFTVKVGNSLFKYEIVDNNQIDIGGYGLFCR